jgi:AcrR family transcriptional regulator
MFHGTEDTRRTANVRPGGRSARVVTRVMEATAYELSRVGYAALRVEDVAARSGVNKTTIYRRWPTKAELVAATVGHPRDLRPIDTGSVRADLRASLLVGVNLSPSQRGILRVVQTERTVPEIDAVTRKMRAALQRARIAMVERGIARGELPRAVDAKLIVDLVSAPGQKALLFNETLDESYIERVLDVVLSGAVAQAAKTAGGARRGAPRRKP